MQEILFDYKLNPTTWAYLSSLMMIGIYFKFHRFWSVRNSDLIGLILFAPALLLLYYGLSKPANHLIRTGYIWLFVVGAVFLVRLLLDSVMVRRPLLEPNLSASGLMFTGISLLVFLLANVITNPPERLEQLLTQEETSAAPNPGYPYFYAFADFANHAITPPADQTHSEANRQAVVRILLTRVAVIFAHLAIVIGIVWIGYRHFDNIHTGMAAAILYLLTFYTSQLTSQVAHVVPAMLLVWAVAAYRRPILAGVLLGLAAGLIYFPLYLLPLWCSFYWRRGLLRFLLGLTVALVLLVVILVATAPDWAALGLQLRQMFGWRDPFMAIANGFWEYCDSVFRYPILAAFLVICGGLALWPAQKNMGTLLSCSAAVMLASQFWIANGGGLYMAWYLPLLILTIFRPNLEDRVALTAVQPLLRRKS